MRTFREKLLLLISLILASTLLAGCTDGCPPTCLGEKMGGVDWNGKNLRKAVMVNSTARQSNFGNVDFSGADLSGVDFYGSSLQSADLTDAFLVGTNLQKTYLSGAIFTNTVLIGADLELADLTGVNLTSSKLTAVSFMEARLVNANLSQLNLAGSYMDKAKMAGIKMDRVNLAGGLLDKVDLSGADLRSSDLRGGWINLSSMVTANLQNANLSGASLMGTDLTGSNLSGASLAGANLVGAILRGADLRGANLTAAELIATPELLDWKKLDDTVIANLSESQWQKLALGDAILDGVKYDDHTIWPEGFVLPDGVIYQPAPAGLMAFQNADKAVLIAGSSTVADLARPLSRAFNRQNPDLIFNYFVTDSASGISQVGGGRADIGMTSRALTPEEAILYPGMRIIPLAYDSLVVVVNLDNPLKTLTVEDLRSIFSGEIVNWKQVGGRDLPITVLEQNNTMLTVFKALVMDKLPIVGDPAEILPSNAALRAAVAAEPGAIGILPQNFVDNSLQLLALNGIRPTPETILAKTYPLVRPLYLLVMNEPPAKAKAWLDFIFSEEGRQAILLEGLEPVSQ